MKWYITVLKKYAVFSGRARRKEYWMFELFNIIFSITAVVLDNLLGTASEDLGYGIIYGLYSLAVLLPSLAVAVRRLHDIGKSGWWIFIGLVPVVGGIWLLVLLATDSQPGANQYGPNPKEDTMSSADPWDYQQAQEIAKQESRRRWGWVFVIGSGLFTLMGICQTIWTIAYSVSSSAAEAVQESGIIAIVAPLGCNAIWLVLWGVLLGLSIKNLRSIRQSAKPTQYLGQNSCQFCGKRLLAGRGIVITGLENAGQAAQQMLARKCECITCGAVFCLECGNAEGYKRGTGATHCPKCGTQVPIEQLI